MLNPSELIDGRYRILQPIGEGELGTIYMASDLETGRLCALKPIPQADETVLEEVRQEIERIQALEHAHIAPPGVLRGGQDLYLVRDFIEGKPLDEVLRWDAPLTLARACSLAKQIAMALEAAHHAGLIHGGLKPARIILTFNEGEETARVLGFGMLPLKKSRFINLARLAVEDGSGRMFGAPEYIAPEQAMGTSAEALDGRADLYSLGVIFYQMLAGELPFKSGPPMETLLAQIFSEPAPLASQPGLETPLAVETLLMRMLAKKRSDRPASATAIIDQLGPWEERPVRAKRARIPTPQEAESITETAPQTPAAPEEEPVETPAEQPQIPALGAPLAPPVMAEELLSPVSSFASPVEHAETGPVRWEAPAVATAAFDSSLFSSTPLHPPEEIEEPPEEHAAPPSSPSTLESFEMAEEAPLEPAAPPQFHAPGPLETHEAFVPDLAPPPDLEIANRADRADQTNRAGAKGFDLHLNEARKTHHGPISLGSYQPAKSSNPASRPDLYVVPQPVESGPKGHKGHRGHRGLKALATAAVIIIILGGAGCGWLYLTGRTYWFNPNFVKSKISFYMASGAANPQTEVVDQPSNSSPPKPINTPQSSAQSQPSPAANPAQTDAAHSASQSSAQSAQSGQLGKSSGASQAQSQAAAPPGDAGQGSETAQNRQAGSGASAVGTPSAANLSALSQAAEKPKANVTTPPVAQARVNTVAESKVVEDAITRGEYYFDRGDYDAAIQVYQDGLAQYPSNAQLTAEITRARRAKAAESKYLR